MGTGNKCFDFLYVPLSFWNAIIASCPSAHNDLNFTTLSPITTLTPLILGGSCGELNRIGKGSAKHLIVKVTILIQVEEERS